MVHERRWLAQPAARRPCKASETIFAMRLALSRACPHSRPTRAFACGPTAGIRPKRCGRWERRRGHRPGRRARAGPRRRRRSSTIRWPWPPRRPGAGIGHPPLRLQGGDALPVQPCPGALGLAGGHELQSPLVVEDVHRRVDPAEADGLLDEVLVGHRVPSGCLPPRRHPYATGGVVVGRQPGSPGRQVCRVVNGEVEPPARRVIRCRWRDRRHGRQSPVPPAAHNGCGGLAVRPDREAGGASFFAGTSSVLAAIHGGGSR
jgi:hypothetical protein